MIAFKKIFSVSRGQTTESFVDNNEYFKFNLEFSWKPRKICKIVFFEAIFLIDIDENTLLVC